MKHDEERSNPLSRRRKIRNWTLPLLWRTAWVVLGITELFVWRSPWVLAGIVIAWMIVPSGRFRGAWIDGYVYSQQDKDQAVGTRPAYAALRHTQILFDIAPKGSDLAEAVAARSNQAIQVIRSDRSDREELKKRTWVFDSGTPSPRTLGRDTFEAQNELEETT